LPSSRATTLTDKADFIIAHIPRDGPGRQRALLVLTARAFGVTVADLRGSSRRLTYSVPRQVGMAIAIIVLELSLKEASRLFGRRDHTTGLAAKKKYARFIESLNKTSMNAEEG
jgi:chromosomal replication initiation ATPase DnaA